MTDINSKTWLDLLPIEIILTIFDYLSFNDIIHTFFFFNQRFQNSLLKNEGYLNSLVFPTTDIDLWKSILSIIGSRIETLNINSIELTFPLQYFPNLKSVIISSTYNLPEEQLNLILENDQFEKLNSFQIKQNKNFSDLSQDSMFKKVFNSSNSLKIFEYSLPISSFNKHHTTNFHLHSITLILTNFNDIFLLLPYVPNLEYLNIQSNLPETYHYSTNTIHINLKQFYFTFKSPAFYVESDINSLLKFVNQYSTSLVCLSLNLVELGVKNTDSIPFNGLKLRQFLESIVQLKHFHLYAKLLRDVIDYDVILSQFRNEYWIDHKWFFGMHGEYLYTLPFHFDYLYEFFEGFHEVKSNNSEYLRINSRIWYHVKSIDLPMISKYDCNFLKEIQIKMPKLNSVRIYPYYYQNPNKIEEKFNISLDSVTTIEYSDDSLYRMKSSLIYSLPNLTHLTLLPSSILPSIYDEVTEILNKKIQRLDINLFSPLEQLTEMSYVYLSNVQYIDFHICDSLRTNQFIADIIMKILKNFQNLKRLIIYTSYETTNLNEIIQYLNINDILLHYNIKHYQEYSLFSKKIQ